MRAATYSHMHIYTYSSTYKNPHEFHKSDTYQTVIILTYPKWKRERERGGGKGGGRENGKERERSGAISH